GIEGILQRQREVQRQRVILVFEIVVDRLLKLLLLAVSLGEGEEAELLQILDIVLGQRRELLAAVDALGLGLDALQRIRREHVVKGPGVADAGDRTIGGVEQLAGGRDPDMWMGLRRRCNKANTARESEQRQQSMDQRLHLRQPRVFPAGRAGATARRAPARGHGRQYTPPPGRASRRKSKY